MPTVATPAHSPSPSPAGTPASAPASATVGDRASGAVGAGAHGDLTCADVEALLGDAATEATRLHAALEVSERDLGNARAQKGVALEEVMASRSAPSLPANTLAHATCTVEDLSSALSGAGGDGGREGVAALLAVRAGDLWQVQEAMAAARDAVLAQWANETVSSALGG